MSSKAQLEACRCEYEANAEPHAVTAVRRSIQALAETGLVAKAVKAGETPLFRLRCGPGGSFNLADLLTRGPVVVSFYWGDWWAYEAERLIPYISNGPLIFWLYPAFGMRGATWFLGVSEWTFGTLLFLGFWNKRLGILGALGSCATFIGTATIIPFMPDGWDVSAGGFPAMTGNVPFLMKDIVLLAVSVYLLRQDVMRVSSAAKHKDEMSAVILSHWWEMARMY